MLFLFLMAAVPAYAQKQSDEEIIKNKQWHVWETQNFKVISLDEQQGKAVADNIEQMKSWLLSRWGLPDVKFKTECRVVIVPSKEWLKRLFNFDQSQVEVRRDDSGKPVLIAVWLILDGKFADQLPAAITTACLTEVEQQSGVKMGLWAQRGMALLNGSLPHVRQKLLLLDSRISSNSPVFFTHGLLTMTEAEFVKDENKDLFDAQAAMLLLLIRRELGQKVMTQFLQANSSEEAIKSVLGYSDQKELDATFKRYMYYLSKDIQSNRTPDSYLNITGVK